MFKVIVLLGCLLAVAQAGVIGGGLLTAVPSAVAVGPAIATSNIIRGIGNLPSVSADANTIDTAFSSVRNADVRITNPGILTLSSQPALAVSNAALAGPIGIAPGLTTAAIASPALAAGIAGHGIVGVNGLGLNGLGLNGLALGGLGGLGGVKVLG